MDRDAVRQLLSTAQGAGALSSIRSRFCVDEQKLAVEQMMRDSSLTFG